VTRTLTITDGTLSVNMINAAATGFMLTRGGKGREEVPLGIREGFLVAETWKFNLRGTSHNNLASQIDDLTGLARRVKEYKDGWRAAPVYIQQQTTGEGSARFSPVDEIVDLNVPDRFAMPFEVEFVFEGVEMTIVREHPWRPIAPGSVGSAVVLEATDGPADPTMVHVANFQDTFDLTHVFVDDGGVFGSNIIAAASGTALLPAAPVANDALYCISEDGPFKHVNIGFLQGGLSSDTMSGVWEYHTGGGTYAALDFGTEITVFLSSRGVLGAAFALFNPNGAALGSANIIPPTDWATDTVNSVTGHPIRFRITTGGTFTGSNQPQKNGDTIYAQRKPFIEIPAASMHGDSPALTCIRMFSPSGGSATDPSPAFLSRVLVGAKSEHDGIDLDNFTPMVNAGGDGNPAAWTVAYGDDTSSVADPSFPGGSRARCTFSTETGLASRVTFTGDDLLPDYRGKYRLLVGLKQVGGAAGDIKAKAFVYLGAVSDTNPHSPTRKQPTRGADDGIEVLDLGLMQLPLSRAYSADSLAGIAVSVDLQLERVTGAGQADVAWVYFFPVDEGSVGVDDRLSDATVGSSALRGGTVFDLDAGLIANRNLKYTTPDGSTLKAAEEWRRYNKPIELHNKARTQIFFLLLHYSDNGWNTEPLLATPGNHLAVQLFVAWGYSIMRGSD